MPGPARAGALLYAKDVERLASFYEKLLPMARIHAAADLIVLESPDFQLVVHAMPPDRASQVVVASPPLRREQSALRLFFTVPGLQDARATAARLGGAVFSEIWHGPGFNVSNACDPEGNVFQLRELTCRATASP